MVAEAVYIIAGQQALHLGKSRKVTRQQHAKGGATATMASLLAGYVQVHTSSSSSASVISPGISDSRLNICAELSNFKIISSWKP